jgi:hypothetical protein
MATLEDILAELKKINKTVGDNEDATKEVNKELETSVDLLKERNEEYEKTYNALAKELETYIKIEEEIKTASGARKNALKEQLKLSKENLKKLKAQTREGQKRQKQLEKTLKVMRGIERTVGAITKLDFVGSLNPAALVDAAHKLQALEKSLTKTGAVSKQFEKKVLETQTRLKKFSLTTEDSAKGLGMLITSTTQFQKASKKTDESIAKTVIALEKGFNAGAEGAQAFEQLATTFGKTDKEASKMVENLSLTGKAMSIPVKQMLTSFQQAAPRLAIYGDGMDREFKRLQATSKATGVSISSLLQISQGFDTFEDAARKTSQLNAMFGTQLNSVDLLNMKDEERIKVIREQLALQGKSVETLGKFELLSLSRIIGVDAATLKAGFKDVGDEVDALIAKGEEGSAQDFGKAVQDAITTQEKFEGAMSRMKNMVVKPIKELLDDIAKFLDENGVLSKVETFFSKALQSAKDLNQLIAEAAGADPTATAVALIGGGVIGTAILAYKLLKKTAISSIAGILKAAGVDVGALATAGAKGGASGAGAVAKGAASATATAAGAAGNANKVVGSMKVAGKTVPIIMGEKIAVEGAETAAKSAPGLLSKMKGTIGKGAGKIAGKGVAKTALKALPGLGFLMALGFGANRAMNGDYLGAGLELASGAAGLFPGIGTVASIGIQGALVTRDLMKTGEGVPTGRGVSAPKSPPAPVAAENKTTASSTSEAQNNPVNDIADQIADRIIKSFNPVINMTAYVGDKQTTVRLVKDALNSSYPLGRATSGG